MKRRDSIKALSAVTAHALFPAVLAGAAEAAAALDTGQAWTPKWIRPPRAAMLEALVDTILPATDTPGARQARVHVFVDSALKRCATADQQRAAVAALDGLGAGFAALPSAEREARLKAIDGPIFALLRDLTLLGYFTSQVGATEALAYVAVPGEYRGCTDLKPGQKAWAM